MAQQEQYNIVCKTSNLTIIQPEVHGDDRFAAVNKNVLILNEIYYYI